MAHVGGNAGGKSHIAFDHQREIDVAVLARASPLARLPNSHASAMG
jgi:hypothetical protein